MAKDQKTTEITEEMTVPQQRAAVFKMQANRETVEAFVVAFILALLFRAFLAEVFVIPTGSMAPALMGAHKDLVCQRCSQEFQVGASLEYRGEETERVVVGGICPNCRFPNSLNIIDEPNHVTFSGDRILVSKFAYTIHEPQRWDVLVFKVPVNPKQNYIKRLVGLPGETISLYGGDVYARPTQGDWSISAQPITSNGIPQLGEIQRKDPDTLMAMRHIVYNSAHQSELLIRSDYPSQLQPWRSGASTPPETSWKVERSAEGLTANVQATDDQTQWIRYYHRWPSLAQWSMADRGQSLRNVDPYESRLITDFYEYDAYLTVSSKLIYKKVPSPAGAGPLAFLSGKTHGGGVFRPDYDPTLGISQFRNQLVVGRDDLADDGMHWVGDLIVEADLETSAQTKTAEIEIVESGIAYRCVIDLNNGQAKLGFADQTEFATATTSVRAGARHRLRFSNCDQQLMLWVDGDVVAFDKPTTFNESDFLRLQDRRPHYNGPGDPLDAAPVALGVTGGSATLHQLTIDRDKYYIAISSDDHGMLDYDLDELSRLNRGTVGSQDVRDVMSQPDVWSEFPLWKTRRSVSFPLHEDEFFPMGDNSPESLDARIWAGSKLPRGIQRSPDEDTYLYAKASYVPRNLLVGKALLVFWPHPWSKPVPLTPNFKRMGRIR